MEGKLATQFKDLTLSAEDKAYIDACAAKLQTAKKELGRAVEGQDRLLELIVLTLAANGNALLTGVPGTGKTVLASSVGKVFGLTVGRIQGTPDLMPSDILGTEILDQDESGRRSFRFEKGPVFANLVLDDEINRASPRTQAALLQAMQEKEVSIAGQTHKLPVPHFHIATQNPIEQEGTNPLPEAQKDRFLIEAELDFPPRESEGKILLGTTTSQYTIAELRDPAKEIRPARNVLVSPDDLKQVMSADELVRIQHVARNLPLGETVYNAILDLVRSARPDYRRELDRKTPAALADNFNFVNQNVEYGPGTRTLQAFALMVKARALMQGRYRPNVDDVVALAEPIMRHRMGLKISAKVDNIDETRIIEKLTAGLK